jgi:hypothetical protein
MSQFDLLRDQSFVDDDMFVLHLGDRARKVKVDKVRADDWIRRNLFFFVCSRIGAISVSEQKFVHSIGKN